MISEIKKISPRNPYFGGKRVSKIPLSDYCLQKFFKFLSKMGTNFYEGDVCYEKEVDKKCINRKYRRHCSEIFPKPKESEREYVSMRAAEKRYLVPTPVVCETSLQIEISIGIAISHIFQIEDTADCELP
jgi:hypothetical protein